MGFRVVVEIDDVGRLSVNSPAPPPIVARALREASATLEADLMAARVRGMIATEPVISLARPEDVRAISRNGEAPG